MSTDDTETAAHSPSRPEICDACGNECRVTFYVKAPVHGKLVCLECKQGRKGKGGMS